MNIHLPNLKHIQYLLALNEHQHFHKAADACFVSQSTLSSAIIKLEQLLDCQLIERDHKSFVFTAHGKAVVAMAEQLIKQASEFVEFSQSQGKLDKGHVYLGCIPTIAPFLLTDVITEVKQRFPDLELFITEAPTDSLLAQLANGDIDIAILATPVDPKAAGPVKVTELGHDAFYLAGDKSLVEQVIEEKTFQQIPDHSVFLLSEEHCLTDHALSACKLVDKTKVNPFAATSLATLLQMTIHHKGITFLPEMAIQKGLADNPNLTVSLLQGQPARQIAMFEREHSPRTESFALLADVVQQFFQKN
ncbi:hydrogen peroxide-inducible genes activator [Thalassotalea sp. HSM 43]|uniref:hydrogen peroxide-inducible genes activator n=1 Tax=Thalassotalea sp. HSM 43 TaxID=2552945 RepID=UPI001080A4FA|nr:hydrogen peroxide-inducible genes activator [Thalassotalea sp. HSM 43]QBY03462.1 hydrogen peroxide-inducible genes activator [Thalassotalea sp. HSM 43]